MTTLINRQITKQVNIRNLSIGGGNRIAVQSMTNLPVENIDGTLAQIDNLVKAGCDIVRIAVPNNNSARAFEHVRKQVNIPLVADIHFDYRLAVQSMEAGADKIRINPGNMSLKDLNTVIDCAKKNDVAVRIGVNGGSVNKQFLRDCNGDKRKALVESVKSYVAQFESLNFYKLVLSAKSSDIADTVYLNRELSKLGYPMHLGVTEAGLLNQGKIKNAIGIGSLLLDGIGDTLRVSLTANPVEEVLAAKEILDVLGLNDGVMFVSCPKCGRCSVDLERVAAEVYDYVKDIHSNIKIAVMGCEVNGPGECRDADLGLAGANGRYAFFRNGEICRYVDKDIAVEEFKKEIDLICKR